MSHNPEESLFAAALERPAAERITFLATACQGDPALRKKVEALLSAHDATANPLATLQATCAAPEYPEFHPPAEEAVGQRLGRYKLLEKLGEGGCGVVYVAEQTEPVRRRVALKIIKLGMDTKSVVARFEAERQALALMDHPNIAKVLDAGTTELGRPFFVMELVRGTRITDYCDHNRLNTGQRLLLFIKVCQAVQHAHQKGIIHRDIKPSNILVTLHDGEPVPKVIDFGIAKATEGRLTEATIYTQLHQFIGTPAYMSPEQAEMSGLDIDTRSDIYSLGVLLYEILTGRPPFDPKELMAQGMDEMRKTIREKEPARPSTRLATLSGEELTTTAARRSVESAKLSPLVQGDLDWIVMKCLEKDRTRRYETANGLAADLRRHLENEPVIARPPSTAYRFQKAWRRNRLVYTAGAVVFGALSLALLQAVIFGNRTNDALQRTEVARASERAQRALAEEAHARADQQRHRAEENQLDSRRRAYAASVVLAQQALGKSDLSRARNLLLSQRPQGGQEDLRGWEWRYLWAQSRPDPHSIVVRQPGGGALSAVAVSPKGDRIAYTNMEGDVEVLNVQTRAIELRATGAGYFGTTFRRIAFSPKEPLFAYHESLNGRQYAVTVWDWEKRTNRFQIATGRPVMKVAISDDGRQLAILEAFASLRVYDLADGTLLLRRPDSKGGFTAALSGNGSAQAIGINSESVSRGECHLYTIVDGLPTNQIIPTTEGMVTSLAFSREGRTLATGAFGMDTEVRLWDVGSGNLIRRLQGHQAYVHQVEFSPDNRWLASASADQTVRLWDWKNGTCVAVLRGHLGEVWSLAFSGDGSTLYSASKDGTVRQWPLAAQFVKQSSPPTLKIAGLAGYLDDQRTLVTIGTNGSVDLWDGTTSPPVRHISLPSRSATCGRMSPDRKRVLIGFANGMVQEWNLAERRLLAEVDVADASIADLRYRFGNAGWLVRSSRQTLLCGTNHGEPSVVLSTNVSPLIETSSVYDTAVVRGNGVLHFWNADRRGGTASFNPGRLTDRFALSPDGQWFAATTYDPVGMATLWSWPGMQIMGEFRQHLLGAHGIAFSPDSRRLATGSVGYEAVRLWDVATQMELVTLTGDHQAIERIEFSPDGNRVAAVNQLRELRVWIAPSWDEINAEDALNQGGAKSP